jgi:lysophospholipase L1-like esterase
MDAKETVITRAIVVFSLAISAILALVIAGTRTYWAWIAAGFMAAALLGWRLAGSRLGRKQSEWLLLLATLNLFVVVPELGLRLADFRYESGIQFGFPRPSQFVHYRPDAKLFWRLGPDHPQANSLGFPGRELITPKPSGTYRIVFLGDSVTHQGYPDYVEQMLNSHRSHDNRHYESVTLAVAGYSSHQGRVLAELYGTSSEPDLVVVYFGWNDHWLAFGEIDDEKQIEVSKGRLRSIWDKTYSASRLLQASTWIGAKLSGHREIRIDQVRVPPSRYRANLQRILEVFQERGVPVLFITAATSQYRFGMHRALVDLGQVKDAKTGIRLHSEYNDIVREVSQQPGAFLLDLESEFRNLPDNDLQAIFLNDRIHLTKVGLSVIADRITGFIERKFLDE